MRYGWVAVTLIHGPIYLYSTSSPESVQAGVHCHEMSVSSLDRPKTHTHTVHIPLIVQRNHREGIQNERLVPEIAFYAFDFLWSKNGGTLSYINNIQSLTKKLYCPVISVRIEGTFILQYFYIWLLLSYVIEWHFKEEWHSMCFFVTELCVLLSIKAAVQTLSTTRQADAHKTSQDQVCVDFCVWSF